MKPLRGERRDGGAPRRSIHRRAMDSIRAVRGALAPLGRRRVLVAAAFGLAPVVLLGGLLAGAGMWATSQPSFCSGCHPMEPFVDAWEVSSHQDVNCEQCHTPPGFFGFVGGKIAGLQVVVNYVRGDFEDYSFNAVVSNGSCLRCHEPVLEEKVHSTGTLPVVVSHRDIVEAGGKCIACHSTVAHGAAVPPGSRTHPTMSACIRCHDDQTAPLRCSLCHVRAPEGTAVPAEARAAPRGSDVAPTGPGG
jgi:cytochrome c nitrite reductase small subunit